MDTPYRDKYVVIGYANSTAVIMPVETPTFLMVSTIRREIRSFSKQHGGNIAVLFVVSQGTKIPDSEVRPSVVSMFEEFGESVKVLATVFDDRGFAAAAKRSIFSVVSRVMFGKLERKTFAETQEATRWLEEKSSQLGLQPVSSNHLLELIQLLRSEQHQPDKIAS